MPLVDTAQAHVHRDRHRHRHRHRYCRCASVCAHALRIPFALICAHPVSLRFVRYLEALGNPMGLFSNIGSGVLILFYEPSKALQKKNSELEEDPTAKDLGMALGKGVQGFSRHTVQGIMESAAAITTTLERVLYEVSMDEQLRQRRRQLACKPSQGLVWTFSASSRPGEMIRTSEHRCIFITLFTADSTVLRHRAALLTRRAVILRSCRWSTAVKRSAPVQRSSTAAQRRMLLGNSALC